MARAYWIMCCIAYWAVMVLPLRSRLCHALLPYAGEIAYFQTYAAWSTRRRVEAVDSTGET